MRQAVYGTWSSNQEPLEWTDPLQSPSNRTSENRTREMRTLSCDLPQWKRGRVQSEVEEQLEPVKPAPISFTKLQSHTGVCPRSEAEESALCPASARFASR